MRVDSLTLQDLQWEDLKREWKALAGTRYGYEVIDSLKPGVPLEELRDRLELSRELYEAIAENPNFYIPSLPDVSFLWDLPEGYILTTSQLWDIADFINNSITFRDLLQKTEKKRLLELAKKLNLPLKLLKLLKDKLASPDDLKDDASPELYRIRKAIISLRETIRGRLNELISKYWREGLLQEPIFTLRNGRFVLPVKVERSSELQGIIQGFSGSTKTAFIEPIDIVHLNNKLVALQESESEEVRRILALLSANVLKYKFLFRKSAEVIGLLDALYSVVRFSYSLGKITFPEVYMPHQYQDIELRGALNPLLRVKPVPVDLEFKGKKVLVITGPNAGGKTVSLKTLGLLVLSAMSGLPVPADSMKIPYLKGVMADISDKQDIEENLSTFSAHIQRWREFLRDSTKNTLVILDEPASGTSPKEGAALTIALVETLKSYGAFVAFSTHFDEVKAWALNHDYTIASFSFDLENLRPTYELRYGVPGYSYAFEICQRSGLSRSLINRAKALMKEIDSELHESLKRLATLRDEYEEKLREVTEKERALRRKERELERLEREIRSRRARAFQTAKQEAIATLESAYREIEKYLAKAKELYEELKRSENFPLKKDLRREIKSLRERALDLRAELYAFSPEEDSEESSDTQVSNLEVGMRVLIVPLALEGVIIEFKGEDYVKVQVNEKLLEVPRSKVRPSSKADVKEEKAERKSEHFWSFEGRVEEVPSELNLRRQKVADALIELSRYIERAKLYGHRRVRIIHGKGTGTLRRAIHEALKEMIQEGIVERFEIAPEEEGGLGATIVYL